MARLFISAAHKSSGKTTVSIGLAAAWAARGLAVQTFKKGPDYIDPMWLTRASGRACFNLDFNTQTHAGITAMVGMRSGGADLALIEGNKGLHDGVDLEGSDCSAALAKLTRSPVVLVIDVLGMTRGIAPLLLGYLAFDPAVRIAGVILNKVGPARQEAKLRQAIERYTALAVLGVIPRNHDLAVTERHLGLMTPAEAPACEAAIEAMRCAVEAGVDLDRLLAIAADAPELSSCSEAIGQTKGLPSSSEAIGQQKLSVADCGAAPSPGSFFIWRQRIRAVGEPAWPRAPGAILSVAHPEPTAKWAKQPGGCPASDKKLPGEGAAPQRTGHAPDIRIAVPRDAAFGFYYADDLEAFERAGAQLSFFDTTTDARLPDADGLFIGGGFPETHAARLAANAPLRADIAQALRSGLPAYAECGGLMYLCRSISWRGETHEMVGVIPADAVMHDRPQGRGLVVLEETLDCPWPPLDETPRRIPAHEFHYAALANLAPGLRFAFRMARGTGISGGHDGIVLGNLLASFSHLRASADNPWVQRFTAFVRANKAAAGCGEKTAGASRNGVQPGGGRLCARLGVSAERR